MVEIRELRISEFKVKEDLKELFPNVVESFDQFHLLVLDLPKEGEIPVGDNVVGVIGTLIASTGFYIMNLVERANLEDLTHDVLAPLRVSLGELETTVVLMGEIGKTMVVRDVKRFLDTMYLFINHLGSVSVQGYIESVNSTTLSLEDSQKFNDAVETYVIALNTYCKTFS